MRAALLLGILAVGSLAVWTAVPLGWLWLAGRIAGSNALSYLTALIVCPALMLAVVVGLARLERAYCRVAGRPQPGAARPGWRRSISDSRRGSPVAGGPLNTLLAASAALAVAALVGWWAFGAGGQPSGPLAPGNEHTPR
ncbi:MAG TPA: hypothetical protein VGW10_08960 [Solirubrobacteraceae bacterium]|nr:hypothetical protein [Solirubrobacteraceae bacterium]